MFGIATMTPNLGLGISASNSLLWEAKATVLPDPAVVHHEF